MTEILTLPDLEAEEKNAYRILDEAIVAYRPSKVFALCSGGHDSLTVTHIASQHPQFAGVVHIDTGIKVIDPGYEPELFVKRVCEQFGWPLLVYRATEDVLADGTPDPHVFEDILINGANGKGFPHGGPPGPAMHSLMYTRLKERQIARLVRDYKQHDKDKIMLVSGVRRHESDRRWKSLQRWGSVNVDGSRIWVSPIIEFQAATCNDYMKKYGIPRNPLKDLICKSGECMCLAFAEENELALIEAVLPVTGAHMRRLEAKCRAAGYPWGLDEAPPPWWSDYVRGNMLYEEFEEANNTEVLPLCTSCISRHLEEKEVIMQTAESSVSSAVHVDTGASFSDMFCYSFPAIRGVQAKKDHFVAMIPLAILARLMIFDESELPPELKGQRALTQSRIPQIANYILKNPDSYTFDAITVAVDQSAVFERMPADPTNSLGFLKVPVNAMLRIVNGQHRYHSIKKAVEEKPLLGEESIAVIFYIDCSIKVIRQKFSDLNLYARNPTKAISISFDSRDDRAIITHQVQQRVELFRLFTELEKNSLSDKSMKLFCLNHLFEATTNLLAAQPPDMPIDAKVAIAINYWSVVCAGFPEWQQVVQRKVATSDIRKEFLHVLGVSLVAMGRLGSELIQQPDWEDYASRMGEINWHRSNPDWEGIVLFGGKVRKNATVVNAIADYIKSQLGIKSKGRKKS